MSFAITRGRLTGWTVDILLCTIQKKSNTLMFIARHLYAIAQYPKTQYFYTVYNPILYKFSQLLSFYRSIIIQCRSYMLHFSIASQCFGWGLCPAVDLNDDDDVRIVSAQYTQAKLPSEFLLHYKRCYVHNSLTYFNF